MGPTKTLFPPCRDPSRSLPDHLPSSILLYIHLLPALLNPIFTTSTIRESEKEAFEFISPCLPPKLRFPFFCGSVVGLVARCSLSSSYSQTATTTTTTMARSLSNAKTFVSLVADNLSVALQRRGYAAASQAVGEMGKRSGRMGKAAQEEMEKAAQNSWVPDPVTGYYRPANRADEIDVAELREIFLKQRIRSQ
ncbi:hypothetical protein Cgig2_020872 [Carnegiea gigantea]|uniref:Late embryogenesis abundant protein n=1 Tax=Carnegiea gigantea TaxID=171969 RepID=A0A9Q1KGS8_9CARY|nr:hypothetical protein Cgig2_020872 [Carnegiea gigantea]